MKTNLTNYQKPRRESIHFPSLSMDKFIEEGLVMRKRLFTKRSLVENKVFISFILKYNDQ